MSGIRRGIAVAASFNIAPLEPVLRFWLDELAPGCELELAPYGQVLELLLGPQLLVSSADTEAVLTAGVILLRPEDLLRSGSGARLGGRAAIARAKAYVLELAAACSHFVRRTCGPLLVGLPPLSPQSREDREVSAFDGWVRAEIAAEIAGAPSIHTVECERAATLYGVGVLHDPIREELAHIPFSDEYLAAIATAVVRRLRALWEPPCKAIVLDCDNTLWGGACGEQALATLESGGPYAVLRRVMLEQARAGRLLCLASRNREADVMRAFARCAAPLTPAHIAAKRISGARKSEAVLSIANELGISPESVVFVDDDSVECAEVRAALPSVTVLELPREAARIPATLAHAWELDVGGVTDADRRRGASYALEARRRRERAAAPSLEEFLAGLKVRVDVRELAPADVPRAAQVFLRTNQFNLTGARFSEAQLRRLAATAASRVLVVDVRDRLGDYGLVGAVALEIRAPRIHVLGLAISCRVLNRGVETRVLRDVVERGRAHGCSELSIAFRAGPRNGGARELLERLARAERGAPVPLGGTRRPTSRDEDRAREPCDYMVGLDTALVRLARLERRQMPVRTR